MKQKIIILFLVTGIIIYTLTLGTNSYSNIFLILIYVYMLALVKNTYKKESSPQKNKEPPSKGTKARGTTLIPVMSVPSQALLSRYHTAFQALICCVTCSDVRTYAPKISALRLRCEFHAIYMGQKALSRRPSSLKPYIRATVHPHSLFYKINI